MDQDEIASICIVVFLLVCGFGTVLVSFLKSKREERLLDTV